jgi:very-short-patch-repair endonuclease
MSAFGFSTTAELRADGYTVERIRAEIGAGVLERVIRGWYCRPGTDRGAVRAMRAGGRISCVSSLALLGGWLPPESPLHVGFPSHASGRRLARRGAPDGTVTHWHPKAAATGSDYAVTPLDLAVADLLLCQPPAFIVATLDSLLHKRVVQRNRVGALILQGPVKHHHLADRLDPQSGSGIESIVTFGLWAAGIRARVQVVVRDAYRVDVLIDDWLVLEIDGRATHAQAKAFTADRVREATIMRDGRIVLRFAYATVMYDWPFVLACVQDVIRQHAPVR